MDKPEPVWKISILYRTMVDFDVLLASEQHAPFFRHIDTIEGMLTERKRLTRSINISYLITFLGACVVLSGTSLSSARISVLGVEAPLSLLPAQVIAILVSSVYAYFATQWASYLVLTQMIQRVLQKEGWPQWQFFEARFDATALWGLLLAPKTVGYRSPRRTMVITLAVFVLSILMVLAHGVIVLIATIFALAGAWFSSGFVLIALASASVATAGLALSCLVTMVAVRFPFRWTEVPHTSVTPSSAPQP